MHVLCRGSHRGPSKVIGHATFQKSGDRSHDPHITAPSTAREGREHKWWVFFAHPPPNARLSNCDGHPALCLGASHYSDIRAAVHGRHNICIRFTTDTPGELTLGMSTDHLRLDLDLHLQVFADQKL